MSQNRTHNWTAERVLVLSSSTQFFKGIEQAVRGAHVDQLENLPEKCADLEGPSGQPPSLIVVDGMWQDNLSDWGSLMKQPLASKIRKLDDDDFETLPKCELAVTRLSGFRVKRAWRNCFIVLALPKQKAALFTDLSLHLGADWVLQRENEWEFNLTRVLSRLKNRQSPMMTATKRQQKLKVLVAENDIDVFALLNVVLGDFCHLVMSLNDPGQSLRDCRTLSAENIISDFTNGSFAAVVVDMALSDPQESFAEYMRGSTVDNMSHEGFKRIVEANLEGLIAVKELRKKNRRVPICIFSSYARNPIFKLFIRYYWGSHLYGSIAVFSKNPSGRSRLREWLVRHSGYNPSQIIGDSMEGGNV